MSDAHLERMSLVELSAPVHVRLDLTPHCNWKRDSCNSHTPGPLEFTPLQHFKAVISQLSRADALDATLFGGEPFLHPRVLGIAEFIRDLRMGPISLVRHGHRVEALHDEDVEMAIEYFELCRRTLIQPAARKTMFGGAA